MVTGSDGQVAPADGSFGGLVRAYRERALLSQEELAERSGLSARTIRSLESGTVRAPRNQSVRLLADALRLAGVQRDRFEEAARPSSQPALAAASSVDVVPHQLPPDIADFVGRTELAEQLQELFEDRSGGAGDDAGVPPMVVCAIAGKAGVGKSTLAVHVAHRLASEFRDGQLYASLGGATEGRGATGQRPVSPLDPAEVLSRFLRALGVDGAAIPDAGEERAALYRSRLAGKRVLVVLDDAASVAQVRALLPGGPGSAVLITGRIPLTALEGVRLVKLDVLDNDGAIGLLARIAGPQRVTGEPKAAAAIVAACGRLPLAVRIAGARLAARPHWSLSRMADLLADEHRRLDQLSHGDLEVRASLFLSYQGLAEEHRRLFRLLGLLRAPDLPAWVAGALLDLPAARAEELMEDLVDAQLVDLAGRDATGQLRYQVHDLLHAYALERAEAEEPVEQQQAALERVLGGWLTLAAKADQRLPAGSLVGGDVAAAGWQPDSTVSDQLLADPLAWFEAERVPLVRAIHQASMAHPAQGTASATGPAVGLAWRLAGSMAGFLQLRSYRDDYRKVCELALAAARRDGDRRGEAWMLVALAELLGDQDRFDEALASAERARLLHREIGDRRGEAYGWFVAGDIDTIRGRFDQAAGELQHAWRLYDAVDDDQGRTWVLHSLGRVHRQQGRLPEAAAALERALTASRIGGDRRAEALVLQGLGLLHMSLGQPDQAVPHLLQSLRICRELGDGLGEGYVLRNLGDARLRQGDYETAAAVLQQALRVFQRVGARRGEAAVLQILGELEQARGCLQQARVLLDAALSTHRDLQIMPLVAKTLIALAEVQEATGDHAGAGRNRDEAHTLLQALPTAIG